MTLHSFSARRPTLRLLVSAIALAGASGAWADDPNPYYLGVSQAISHDSNIYRTTEAIADTYYSTGLLAGIDQPFGRQHFYANGNVQLNRFAHTDTQNNTSYGLKTGLDWSTIGRISGSATLALNQSLASYGSANTIQLQKKNVQTSDQFAANAKWGGDALLSLNAGFAHNQIRYSAEEYKPNNLTQDTVSFGAGYRPSALITFGAALRHTRGRYPEIAEANGNDFNRNDFDLTTYWVPSGQSSLNARVSLSRQSYNGATARDFSGVTGALSWNYKPTGKLTFTTGITRDTGSDTSFLSNTTGTTPVAVNGDNSRITNSITIGSTYAATGKINATASLRYSRRSLVDTLAITGNGQESVDGKDTSRGGSIGVNYTPARNWLLACNLSHDSRTATQGAIETGLSYTYSDNAVGCSAQFTLQ